MRIAAALACRRARIASIALVLLAVMAPMLATQVSAQVVFLQNDSWNGGSFGCFAGIREDGEGLAAAFTASMSQYPYDIDRIRVLVCGGGEAVFGVSIFEDHGTTVPGPLIWESLNSYVLSGANAFNDILMSLEPIPPPTINSGSIRVLLSVPFATTGVGFGYDLDGITPSRNFVRTASGAWAFAEAPPDNLAGDWVLRIGISPNTMGVDPAVKPPSVMLQQNEPNPFSGSTTLRFSVRNESEVTLLIHDCAGRVVAAPIRQRRFEPGAHQVEWRGEGLPAGVYFCRLYAGGEVYARKLLLMR